MKKYFVFAIFIATCMFFSTCTREDYLFLDQEVTQKMDVPTDINDETFVSLQQATNVAKAFIGVQSTLKSAGTQKRIVSTETIKDKENPSMYVMNYADGGWVIVGSTRNYYPILAYSDENSFELTEDMGPVTVWLEETKEAIRSSNALPDSVKFSMQAGWNNFETDGFQMPEASKLKGSDPALDAYIARMNQVCQIYPSQGYNIFPPLSGAASYIGPSNYNYIYQNAISCGANPNYSIVVAKKENLRHPVGPLLATNWHQWAPFNYYCNGYPAGCVTISLAQIMKFHQHPTAYNWGNMPNTVAEYFLPYTNYSTPSFIYGLGFILGLNYATGSTGANDNNIKQALTIYDYSYTVANHNATDVLNEIVGNKRPVSMGGYTKQTLGIPHGDGHQWVCDGSESYQYITKYFIELQIGYSYVTYNWCGSASNPLFNVTQTGTNFHMNWGWANNCDGWYISNDVDSGNGNYQHGRTNFYIKPN